jgi:hypothetical protein
MGRDGAICATGMSVSRGRRWLLAATVLAATDAPVRMSKADAHYQELPRGGLSCVGCTFFRRPAACQVVEGEISPNGWCRLFDLPD